MADLQAALAAHVSAALTAEFGAEYAGADPLIRPSAFADFQANVAMALAKRLGLPPRDVATRIASHLARAPMCERAEVSGPGFINITLGDTWIGEAAAAQLGDPRLGVPVSDRPQRVIVDYSAPNVAKEMHVGHLRTTIVGDVGRPHAGAARAHRDPGESHRRLGHELRHAPGAPRRHRRAGRIRAARRGRDQRRSIRRPRSSSTPIPPSPTGRAAGSWRSRPVTRRRCGCGGR